MSNKSERHSHRNERDPKTIESLDQIYLKRRLACFENISMIIQDDQGTITSKILENMLHDKSMQET